MMTLPPVPTRPRELPLAIILLFLSLLYIGVWPVVGLPRDGGGSAVWFVAFVPAFFAAWLTPIAYRGLGFAAYGGFCLLLGAGWAWLSGDWTNPVLTSFQGLGCWLILGAAIRYIRWLSRSVGPLGPHRIAYLQSRNRTVFVCGLGVLAVSFLGFVLQQQSVETYRNAAALELVLLSALGLLLGGTLLFRPFFELTLEPLFWLMYAIRGAGPGRAQIPPFGPCLIVANHAAWFDPIFIEKVVSRPTTFIMTSRFYNLWFLKPLLKHVFRVIVVQDKPLRRNTPEIQEAIAALDRGSCVVMYPEGFLRRKEEVPLRRFGQGIWQILSARPTTPIIACWIEGSWGSYCSYAGGPPTQNKKLDRRRPIGVALSSPFVIPAALLEKHMVTRIELMNRVLAVREHLGLPPLPVFELPSQTSEEDETAAAE